MDAVCQEKFYKENKGIPKKKKKFIRKKKKKKLFIYINEKLDNIFNFLNLLFFIYYTLTIKNKFIN